ncbi:unnamed protein product [Calypogeia fissa]
MPKKADTNDSNGSKPMGRTYTVSMAVAGSVIDNTMSLELATLLAGQIARAAAIFRIDEVIVYDDNPSAAKASAKARRWNDCADDTGAVFMARVLQYLETPQYLRRALFPMHASLRFVGLLPPLDPPHHLRKNEWLSYREGVVLEKTVEDGNGSYVNVGLAKDVIISEKLKPSTRVTVEMGSSRNFSRVSGEKLKAVAPSEPREKAGLYWGYSARLAPSFSSVFTDCPFKDGYDYGIGTSEHGEKPNSADFVIPPFKHLLIVFGGVTGLEWSLKQDTNIEVDEVSYLFDRYLNTCPAQGSRTIRTEEAILISLQYLQNPIERACQ